MAVKAPKVQTLAQATKDLNPAYAESKNVINQQMSGLGAKYDAQRAGIYAERGQGFNAINNQATGRGGSFSGVPIDEQSTYLSTKFLPGLQLANYQQNEEGLQLKGRLADVNKEQRVQALGTVQQQQQSLNAWNLQKLQIQATAKENALNRAHETKLTNMKIGADRASAAAQQTNVYDTVEAMLKQGTGTDGRVSPTTWAQAAAYASRNGLSFNGKNGFANQFWSYANEKHWQDYKNSSLSKKYK